MNLIYTIHIPNNYSDELIADNRKNAINEFMRRINRKAIYYGRIWAKENVDPFIKCLGQSNFIYEIS